MSKNQRSRIFQATKKPNFVFRLRSRFRNQRRDKIEFQFAVPKYRRTHSRSFRFQEPRVWRDFDNNEADETVNSHFAKNLKFFTPPADSALTKRRRGLPAGQQIRHREPLVKGSTKVFSLFACAPGVPPERSTVGTNCWRLTSGNRLGIDPSTKTNRTTILCLKTNKHCRRNTRIINQAGSMK
jgi:hypothetical protein